MSCTPPKIKQRKMAAAKSIETQSKGAEIYHGEGVCREKLDKLFNEFSVPTSLMPQDGIIEFGFNRSTGFFWLKQKEKKEHSFKRIGQTIMYNVEITAFIEHRHLSKITGIKGKVAIFSITIIEVLVASSDMVKFTSAAGLHRVYPIAGLEPLPLMNLTPDKSCILKAVAAIQTYYSHKPREAKLHYVLIFMKRYYSWMPSG